LRFVRHCNNDAAVPASRGVCPLDLIQGLPMSGFAVARQKMVDGQVRTSDVTDIRILGAMLEVPRELFVPDARRELAYLDLDLDVSQGGPVRRFLIKPAVTGKLLQAANIGPADSVLIVGAATGYMAALAARLAGQVVATESDPSVAGKAKEALAKLGLENVAVKVAEPAEGDAANGPYDVILLNGATEVMPRALCEQLKNGGRLVGVFAFAKPARAMVITRSHGRDFGNRQLFDAGAPVLPGLEKPPAFVF
jgi:protein-L-isoaspartate(D-aspartate) O-methyltransferase